MVKFSLSLVTYIAMFSGDLGYSTMFTQLIRLASKSLLCYAHLCLGIVVTLGIALLFSDGEIVMRILSKRELKEMVLYSPQHVARLEKAGLFPKRVQLGPNRVGWVEREVLDWLEERLMLREIPN